MYTHSLCRGQIIDAVPAHLQQQKRYKQADQCLAMCRGTPQTEMDICQIGKPGSRRPSLFRVPAPVTSPRLICPNSTEEDACRQQIKPYMQGHFIDDAEFTDMGLQQGYFRRIAGTHECKGKQTEQETDTEEAITCLLYTSDAADD